MRGAYAGRILHLGDPNFNAEMPIEKIISKEYAAELREGIELKKASVSDSANFNNEHAQYESSQTTNIAVVDKNGNAVSLIYTLERSYGSKIVVEGAGFLLNNEMGYFNPIPGYTDTSINLGHRQI